MGLLDILQGSSGADPQQLAALYAAAGMDGAQFPYGFLNAPPPVQMTGADAQPLGRPPQPSPGAMARPVDPSVTDIAGGIPPGGARPSDPQQGLAAIYAAAGMPGVPQVDTPGGPPPPAPAPAPVPASGFGAGAAPFSFAGPGSPNFPKPPAAPAIAAAPAAEQASPIAVGSNYMMPRIGAADDFEPDDSTPANAAPTQGRAPAPQTAPMSLGGAPSVGFGDRLNASVQSFANTDKGGLLGKLANGVSSLVTGQRSDPTGVAIGQQAAAANANGRMLLAAGAPMAAVQAAMVPGNTAALTALFNQYLGKDKWTHAVVEDADGTKTPIAFNNATGEWGGKAPGVGSVVNGNAVMGPNGKLIQIPEGVNRKEFIKKVTDSSADAATGKQTESQAKASSFAARMETAEKMMPQLQNQGLSLYGAAAGSVPGGNLVQGADYQKYEQAKSAFITALLRQESGAAINKSEFTRYEAEMFPRPGDAPEVVQQKAQMRAQAIQQMKRAAGPGYQGPAPVGASGKTAGGIPWSVN